MSLLIKHLEAILNIEIKDESLFKRAFMHKSYVNEQKHKLLESNERLEFLGDAVLEIITSDYLYKFYPNEPEGSLSRTRAQLVREPSLALLARKNQFHKFIQLGKGESSSGGNNRDSILADCFEAFLGATYLEQGIEVVTEFLNNQLLKNHQQLLKQLNLDYKTLFQEKAQTHGSVLIEYRLISKQGPDHNQIFEMGLFVDEKLMSRGKGNSKKQAEIQAAKIAYQHLIGEVK
ncbi:ribonuclease III [Aerococcaceae bacterium DSM 111021]|nr:ribonuclease III [Aerococcaceae bacterium DSM 111021]